MDIERLIANTIEMIEKQICETEAYMEWQSFDLTSKVEALKRIKVIIGAQKNCKPLTYGAVINRLDYIIDKYLDLIEHGGISDMNYLAILEYEYRFLYKYQDVFRFFRK